MNIPIPSDLISFNENWRLIPSRYDQDYWISDKGRVWSCKRWRGKVGRFLKLNVYNKYTDIADSLLEYPVSYQFFDSKKNYRVNKLIHELVAEVFVKNPNNWLYVHFLNGDVSDRNAANLGWAQYPQSDAERNNLLTDWQNRHWNSQLTDEERIEELNRMFES